MQIFYLIFLLLFGCADVEFPWQKITFSEATKIAENNNKIIMIDFYADW